jgi:hypothetical protein
LLKKMGSQGILIRHCCLSHAIEFYSQSLCSMGIKSRTAKQYSSISRRRAILTRLTFHNSQLLKIRRSEFHKFGSCSIRSMSKVSKFLQILRSYHLTESIQIATTLILMNE